MVAWDSVHIKGGYINLCRNTRDWEEEGEEEDDRLAAKLLWMKKTPVDEHGARIQLLVM